MERTTHDSLTQWGLWSKDLESDKLGYPKMTAFRRLAGATLDWDYDVKDVPIYRDMSDEEAGALDKIITRLDLDLRTAIYLRYVENYRIGKIEKAMKLKRNGASKLIDTAIRIIEYKLNEKK